MGGLDAGISMCAGDRSSLDRPALCWAILATLAGFAVSAGEPKHGFSYFGDLKYPRDMPHFDYANPAAPKGGVARMPMIGTFNNLHAFVDKGILAVYLDPRLGGLIYDPLLVQSEDELASYYGSLAETVEVADDLSSVAYTLRDNAYWHDGTPVTVADVLWTFDTIKERGGASWKSSYSDIVSLEQTGPRSFRFRFRESVEKTPHLVIQTGEFTPLPKHYWADRDFEATTLEPPLGNGPYRVAEVDPGHKVALERVDDYWGRDLNINVGHFNFDRVEALYFFDTSVMLQALRAGVLDYYRDQDESVFATAYDFAVRYTSATLADGQQDGESVDRHPSAVAGIAGPLVDSGRAGRGRAGGKAYGHSGMFRHAAAVDQRRGTERLRSAACPRRGARSSGVGPFLDEFGQTVRGSTARLVRTATRARLVARGAASREPTEKTETADVRTGNCSAQ